MRNCGQRLLKKKMVQKSVDHSFESEGESDYIHHKRRASIVTQTKSYLQVCICISIYLVPLASDTNRALQKDLC